LVSELGVGYAPAWEQHRPLKMHWRQSQST